ncbi:MAG: Arsenate reductase [Myxococcales bacterium]|nr:Arsenate reductase [Myxococcales bacterium]
MAITGVVQIFGTKKCAESRKAERWFKERSVKIQFVDLKEKGLSAGELRSVAARVGLDKLVDRESQRFRDKGLRVASFSGPLLEKTLLEDALLLKTPIVRHGKEATVGFQPETWVGWMAP